MERVILHSDLNNFYASVECLYNPSLRGKPVAVAGDPEARHGIVLAKNYEAKACGVATGNPLWMAKQKCPDSGTPVEDGYCDPSVQYDTQQSGICQPLGEAGYPGR